MAKPDIVRLYSDPAGTLYRQGGMRLKTLDLVEVLGIGRVIQRQVLKRTGSVFEADSPLDLTSPDSGWKLTGTVMGVEDETDLLVNIKIYRNGQLLTARNGLDVDFDFYFVEENKVAFIFSIRKNEVLQISKNFEIQ